MLAVRLRGTRLPSKAIRVILYVQRLFVKFCMSKGFSRNVICPTAFRVILCPTAFRKILCSMAFREILYVQRLFVKKLYVQRLFVKKLYVQRLFVKNYMSNGFSWNFIVQRLFVKFVCLTNSSSVSIWHRNRHFTRRVTYIYDISPSSGKVLIEIGRGNQNAHFLSTPHPHPRPCR